MFEAIEWAPPSELSPELLKPFIDQVSSQGVTALFDAYSSEASIQAAHELDQAGDLPLDYHASLVFDSLETLDDGIAEAKRLEKEFGTEHVTVDSMKLFLDGTNEIGTSAVLEPFHSHGGGTGDLRLSQTDLEAALDTLNRDGLDLHIHVVGDRGFRVALDAVEAAKSASEEPWNIQVTLAHNELVDPSDMPRVAEVDVILNWTPHWSGGYFGTGAAEYLGWDRFNSMYQFNPMIATGGLVTFGSDVVTSYEAHRADPFFGMQIAATRVDPEAPLEDSPGTVPGTHERQSEEAKLSVEDLLQGYTINGAIQLRIDDKAGSIEVGKNANLVVLSAHPSEVPISELASITPEAVMFEGSIVSGPTCQG